MFETSILQRMGDKLKRWRLDQDETQQMAADRLGFSLSTIRRMEAGVDSIPIRYWLRAIDFYGPGIGTFERFLEEANRPEPPPWEERNERAQRASRRPRDADEGGGAVTRGEESSP